MDLAQLKSRLAIVQNSIANFDTGLEQAGRGDKFVRYRKVDDLYGEESHLRNQIALKEGKASLRTYAKNGGRGNA